MSDSTNSEFNERLTELLAHNSYKQAISKVENYVKMGVTLFITSTSLAVGILFTVVFTEKQSIKDMSKEFRENKNLAIEEIKESKDEVLQSTKDIKNLRKIPNSAF